MSIEDVESGQCQLLCRRSCGGIAIVAALSYVVLPSGGTLFPAQGDGGCIATERSGSGVRTRL